ncbi:hypothetical protein [Aliivibrio logei]|uniref:hypothetical protein n=1 Tax=Aliivibrio logei TaxID=688 RepID=UPI0035C90CBC
MARNRTEDISSPYIPDLKTKEEALEFFNKGMFHVQDRIGMVFKQKFNMMRRKIHKVLDHDQPLDELSYDVYVTSILVDCRALFLESKYRKTNSTLQNFYISRGFEDLAESIDEKFVNKDIDGKKLGEIIKSWVDKRVVHVDYIDEELEVQNFDNVLSILRRDTVENIFVDLLLIAGEYEEFKQKYGHTMTEQMERFFEAMTGN